MWHWRQIIETAVNLMSTTSFQPGKKAPFSRITIIWVPKEQVNDATQNKSSWE